MLAMINNRAVQVLAWWVLAVSRRPALTVLLLIAATIAAAAYTATHVTVNSDFSEMIGKDVPYKRTFDQFNKLFPHQDNVILVVVDGDSAEYAETAATELYRAISADRAAIEYVYWPAGEAFFRKNGLLYLKTDELVQIADRLAAAQPLLGQLAADPSLRGLSGLIDQGMDAISEGRASAGDLSPLLDQMTRSIDDRLAGRSQAMSWRALMSKNPAAIHARELLLIKPVQDFRALEPVGAALDRIDASIAALPPAIVAHTKVRLTGEAMLSYEEIGSATKGIGAAAVLSLILLAFILIWGLRSPWLAATAFLTIVVGLIWTAFFAVTAFDELNLISVTFAVLFVGLAEDFVIHFGLRVREGIDSGRELAPALGESAEGAGSALLFLAAATATGFLAFVPTEYTGLAELGIIASAGMVIALFITLTLMPALLSLRPLARRPRRNLEAAVTAESGLKHHAGTVTVVSVVAAVAAIFLLPRLQFDPDTFHLKDPTTMSVTTLLDLIAGGDTAAYPVDFMVTGLPAAREKAAKAKADPTVARVTTIETYVPEDQDEKLTIIGDMALYLGPILHVPAVAPPSPAEIRDSLATMIAKITTVVASGKFGDAAPSVNAFVDALSKLKDLPDNELREADGDLFRFFPFLLEQLERALSAEPITINTLPPTLDRKSTRLNSSHLGISYAVFCL